MMKKILLLNIYCLLEVLDLYTNSCYINIKAQNTIKNIIDLMDIVLI